MKDYFVLACLKSQGIFTFMLKIMLIRQKLNLKARKGMKQKSIQYNSFQNYIIESISLCK